MLPTMMAGPPKRNRHIRVHVEVLVLAGDGVGEADGVEAEDSI
jgi:hypothetical protein